MILSRHDSVFFLPGRHHPAFPGPGAQRVCYYGWYSNKMRGVRHRGLSPELMPPRPGVWPQPPLKLPPKKWLALNLRVWQVDPRHRPPHLLGTSIQPSAFSLQPLAFSLSSPPPARFAPESRYFSRSAWPLGRGCPATLSALGPNRQKLGNIFRLRFLARSGRMGSQ